MRYGVREWLGSVVPHWLAGFGGMPRVSPPEPPTGSTVQAERIEALRQRSELRAIFGPACSAQPIVSYRLADTGDGVTLR